ncbi:MAG: outer membrane lipoprotein-sorting protein [Candidatus Aminicenantia bacterium]
MRKRINFLGLIGIILIYVQLSFSLTGDEILVKVEATQKASKDSQGVIKMIIVSKRGSKKERIIRFWGKRGKGENNDLQLLVFSSPAEVKNIGFLVKAEDQMYLYLPGYRKVRRIASHSKRQSFVGSDFSYEDISPFYYTKHYQAELKEETEKSYLLELNRKPDSDRAYSKILMWVDKESFLPNEMEMYDNSGKIWKRTEASNQEKIKGYWISRKIKLEDIKKGGFTTLIFEQIDFDLGLSETMFTTRSLKRGGK